MQYAVTYCVMDHTLGTNPFWHSCLLLSQWEDNSLIKVVDHWGFYGVPGSSKEGNFFISKLKSLLKLKLDLQGNHGILRHEQLRFLDAGYGLHGITFELDYERFKLLQTSCLSMARGQEQAIAEWATSLKVPQKSPETVREYAYEDAAPEIFAEEKNHAAQKGTAPRLRQFELHCSLGLFGPNFNKSYTCKSQALDLLKNILPQKYIDDLTEHGKYKTIPRRSGKLERIFLHSSGPLRTYIKNSGRVVHYRDLQTPNVELHWTLPPQKILPLSASSVSNLMLPKDYYTIVKTLIGQLQKIEWFFIDVELPDKCEQQRQNLIAYIRRCYKEFAILTLEEKIESVESEEEIKEETGKESDQETQEEIKQKMQPTTSTGNIPNYFALQKKIEAAKTLFTALHSAIIDDWELLDDDCEAVAAYLTNKDQRKLCKLIERPYFENSFTPRSIEKSTENVECQPEGAAQSNAPVAIYHHMQGL